MVWAIVNRAYRGADIKAVSFPVYHVGRILGDPELNIAKVQGEIVGSTLYAGLTEFLKRNPSHELDFTPMEAEEVGRLVQYHLSRRLADLERSFDRMVGLRESIRRIARPGELGRFLAYADQWFTPGTLKRIRAGVFQDGRSEVGRFLNSLRAEADEFASASVGIEFVTKQQGRTHGPNSGGQGHDREQGR
jgi:hypothetical protein